MQVTKRMWFGREYCSRCHGEKGKLPSLLSFIVNALERILHVCRLLSAYVGICRQVVGVGCAWSQAVKNFCIFPAATAYPPQNREGLWMGTILELAAHLH